MGQMANVRKGFEIYKIYEINKKILQIRMIERLRLPYCLKLRKTGKGAKEQNITFIISALANSEMARIGK